MVLSFEQQLYDRATCKIDIYAKDTFHDCLSPNEPHPELWAEHLARAEKGVFVSCGTERSFFLLLQAPAALCESLVVVDCNPRVIAYVRFNILLLRICRSLNEYNKLKWWSEWQFYVHIKELISNDPDLSENIRQHYLENYEIYGKVFYGIVYEGSRKTNDWLISEAYKSCHYFDNEQQFLTLQNYAQSGKIVATLGDINQLSFLAPRKITVVDTSNIKDYTMIDLQYPGPFQPRVLFTRYCAGQVNHCSHVYKPLTEDDRVKYERLLEKVRDFTKIENTRNSVRKILENDNSWKHKNDNFNYYHGLFADIDSAAIVENCLLKAQSKEPKDERPL